MLLQLQASGLSLCRQEAGMGIFKEIEIEQEDALLLSSFEEGGYEPDEYTLVLPGLDSDVSDARCGTSAFDILVYL